MPFFMAGYPASARSRHAITRTSLRCCDTSPPYTSATRGAADVPVHREQRLEPLGLEGLARLGFDQRRAAVLLDQQVNLVADVVAPVVRRPRAQMRRVVNRSANGPGLSAKLTWRGKRSAPGLPQRIQVTVAKGPPRTGPKVACAGQPLSSAVLPPEGSRLNLHTFFAIASSVAALVAAGSVNAALVVSGSGAITDTDATETSRLTRNAVQSTWASPKAFPGTISGSFRYDEIAVTFAANAFQDVYYEISQENFNVGGSPHLTAYLSDYVPGSLATNYLGDYGGSPVPSGGLTTFQVIVPAGESLVLMFESTSVDLPANYAFSVHAYSDANRNENFASPVPEPGSLALLSAALVGFSLSQRRKRA